MLIITSSIAGSSTMTNTIDRRLDLIARSIVIIGSISSADSIASQAEFSPS
jgi:butyrate kinase